MEEIMADGASVSHWTEANAQQRRVKNEKRPRLRLESRGAPVEQSLGLSASKVNQ